MRQAALWTTGPGCDAVQTHLLVSFVVSFVLIKLADNSAVVLIDLYVYFYLSSCSFHRCGKAAELEVCV